MANFVKNERKIVKSSKRFDSIFTFGSIQSLQWQNPSNFIRKDRYSTGMTERSALDIHYKYKDSNLKSQEVDAILKEMTPKDFISYSKHHRLFELMLQIVEAIEIRHYPFISKVFNEKESLRSMIDEGSSVVIVLLDRIPFKDGCLSELKEEILCDALHYCNYNKFTNKVLCKFVEQCSKELILPLLQSLKSEIGRLAMQPNPFLLRNLIERCYDAKHYELITNGLKGEMVEICKRKNANVDLIPYLQRFPTEYSDVFLEEVLSHVKELSMDPNGSLSLRAMMKNLNERQREKAFSSLDPHMIKLSTDASGGFVVQHLISIANEEQIRRIVESMTPVFKELSTQKVGAFTVNALVKRMNNEQLTTLLDVLSPHLTRLSDHPFGNYLVQDVIKKCKKTVHFQSVSNGLKGGLLSLFKSKYSIKCIENLLNFPPEFTNFDLGQVVPHLKDLAMDSVGYLNLMTFIAKANSKQIEQILNGLLPNFGDVSAHKLGTFVAQWIVERSNEEQITKILNTISPYFPDISNHQFGYFMVQKLISRLETDSQVSIFDNLVKEFHYELTNNGRGNDMLQEYARFKKNF
eukprot:TRINITY_DN6657_c0_g1_i1.p1 TRINITY_DN6657_c0_g1~~TRINITY_DN6657_c0_g1_i1.p1  ORF type:complete len:610 (-),score=167.31 TRINITY_DN6657_c0_g1_i1:364-2097(-)